MDAIPPTPPHEGDSRPRWIVAELDVHGEIDAHAAICLRNAVDAARGGLDAVLLVDLRDLTAIDDDGLRLLVELQADSRVRRIGLELLICADARHDAIAGAFETAGLTYARSAPRAGAHSDPPPAGRRTALPSPTAPIRAASVAATSGTPRWGVMTAATSAVASG
jgi:anti-anti-sigma factor